MQWEQQFWPQPMVAHVSIGLANMPISYDMQHGPYYWSPTTSAKPTILLLQEIQYAGQVPVETGREFAQEALDTAADLRHDLAVLGLTSTLKTGMKTSTKTLYVPNPKVGYWSKPETKKPKMEEHHMEDGEDADEEERFS